VKLDNYVNFNNVFLLILIITLFIVFNILKKSKEKGIQYKVGRKFILEYNPKLYDEVKFWNNGQNEIINIYLKGTSSGQGKIGVINSIPDLKKFQEGKLKAIINKITDDSIFIKFQ